LFAHKLSFPRFTRGFRSLFAPQVPCPLYCFYRSHLALWGTLRRILATRPARRAAPRLELALRFRACRWRGRISSTKVDTQAVLYITPLFAKQKRSGRWRGILYAPLSVCRLRCQFCNTLFSILNYCNMSGPLDMAHISMSTHTKGQIPTNLSQPFVVFALQAKHILFMLRNL